MNYDEAIKATERLYDETIYLKSESPFPNRSDRDFLIKFIETAKKEHELYTLFAQHVMSGNMLPAYRIYDKIKELERELK